MVLHLPQQETHGTHRRRALIGRSDPGKRIAAPISSRSVNFIVISPQSTTQSKPIEQRDLDPDLGRTKQPRPAPSSSSTTSHRPILPGISTPTHSRQIGGETHHEIRQQRFFPKSRTQPVGFQITAARRVGKHQPNAVLNPTIRTNSKHRIWPFCIHLASIQRPRSSAHHAQIAVQPQSNLAPDPATHPRRYSAASGIRQITNQQPAEQQQHSSGRQMKRMVHHNREQRIVKTNAISDDQHQQR
ncbi:hypothetical protein ACLOJK_025590 [Asimina triloba]